MTKVAIRERDLRNGKVRLYLDYWPPVVNPQTGKNTRREFPKGLWKYKNPTKYTEKEHNKIIRIEAIRIEKERIEQLETQDLRFFAGKLDKISLREYYAQAMKTKSKSSYSNGIIWNTSLRHLSNFLEDGDVPLQSVNREFCERYKYYLKDDATSLCNPLKGLSLSTARQYFIKFSEVINEAVDDDILRKNPLKKVKGIKVPQPDVDYLAKQELQILDQMPYENDVLRRSFLFSCFTGLRYSDVYNLTWANLPLSDGQISLDLIIKKTKHKLVTALGDQAQKYLSERGLPGEKVFKGLSERLSNYHMLKFKAWLFKSGVHKDIHFHCSRHTFAFLILDSGQDMYTLMSLLGDVTLDTAMRYAKIADRKKSEAVNKINLS